MSTTAPTIPLGTGVRAITLVIQTNQNTTFPFQISGDSQIVYNRLSFFLNRLKLGSFNSNILFVTGGVYATGTATLSGVVANDTIVIGGVTLTAVASNPTSAQFLVGGSNSATATNLAAAINANTSLNPQVQATVASNVVTIACLIPGTIGNLVTLAQTGGHITIGANLTGGTNGTKGDISHGL